MKTIKLQKSHAFKEFLKRTHIRHFIKEHTLFDKVILFVCLFFTIAALIGYTFLQAHINIFERVANSGDNSMRVYDFNHAASTYKTLDALLPGEKTIIQTKERQLALERTAHVQYTQGLIATNLNAFGQATTYFNAVNKSSQDYINASSEARRVKNVAEEETNIQTKFQDTLAQAYTEVTNNQTQTAEDDFAKAYQIAISDRVLSVQADTITSINNSLDNLKAQIQQAQDISKQDKVQETSAHQTQGPKITAVRVPILMYHYIRINPDPTDILGFNLSVTPSDFDQQMQYLSVNQYTTITMMDLVNALKNKTPLPSKPIILTFDDGYTDFYSNAYPILKKYNLKAESYVITGFVGQSRYLTWDQIKEMYSSGLITIGSHSIDHPDLRTLSPQTLQDEMVQSKHSLESVLNTTITDFCYPYGDFNSTVVKAAIDAGYINATTTQASAVHTSSDYETMPRVRISGGMSLASFIEQL